MTGLVAADNHHTPVVMLVRGLPTFCNLIRTSMFFSYFLYIKNDRFVSYSQDVSLSI